MKRILAIVLAAVLVLSCNMTAFAGDNDGIYRFYTYDNSGNVINTDLNIVNGAASIGSDANVAYVLNEGKNTAGDSVEGLDVRVSGNVETKAKTDEISVKATAGKTTIQQDVIQNGDEAAIEATNAAIVTVKGDVYSKGGNAIEAYGGAEVTVDGDVKTDDAAAVYVYLSNKTGSGSNIEIKGNIVSVDEGVHVYDSKVIVHGDIASDSKGIEAHNNSTVTVGGDVTDSSNNAIYAAGNSTIVVEGLVKGTIDAGGPDNPGVSVFVGELQGNINPGDENKVYYLVGMADGASGLKEFNWTGTGGIGASGINKSYNTVIADGINGSRLTITPKEKKKIDISKFERPAGVTLEEKDGTLIIKFDENFKGGLQDMFITLSDIINPTPKKSSSGSTYTLFTGTTGNPVTNGRWAQNADGTWSYATSVKFTDTWGYIANPNDASSAAWYYFDRNGNMLTGWQLLTWNGVKKWYYFSQTKDANEGKCLVNCITPDGYKVGPDGALIED